MPSSLKRFNDLQIYEAVFKNTSIGIIVVNRYGVIESINPHASSLFNYMEEELIGNTIEKLIPDRYQRKQMNLLENHQCNDSIQKMGTWREVNALQKNGAEFPVEISIGKYWLKGEIGVIVFVNEITRRKKSEYEIKQLNTELELMVRLSNNVLNDTLCELEVSRDNQVLTLAYQKALFDNAGVMIIATDENGMIQLFNQEAVLKTGYTEAEMVYKETPLIFHDHEEIEIKRRLLFKEFGVMLPGKFDVLVEMAKRNIHSEEEYTYVRKDGSRFPVSLTITCITNGAGEISGFIGVALDVSERKKAEQALCEAFQKEKDLGQLKSKFVTLASHEFKTPLCTILSSTYLLQEFIKGQGMTDVEIYLQRIKSSARVLTDTLDGFIHASKMEEGNIQVKPSELNLCELVKSVTDEIKNKVQQEIRYEHIGQEDVFIDGYLLKNIIKHLLSNATKYSEDNTIVEIKTTTEESHITLSVKDRGTGIQPGDGNKLMHLFFRGTNADNIPGVGLGLHLVSKYTELMNGTIEYESEPGKGTEFMIRFKK